jgi:hypothetical protein
MTRQGLVVMLVLISLLTPRAFSNCVLLYIKHQAAAVEGCYFPAILQQQQQCCLAPRAGTTHVAVSQCNRYNGSFQALKPHVQAGMRRLGTAFLSRRRIPDTSSPPAKPQQLEARQQHHEKIKQTSSKLYKRSS